MSGGVRQLVFFPGDTEECVMYDLLDDGDLEPADETFNVTASSTNPIVDIPFPPAIVRIEDATSKDVSEMAAIFVILSSCIVHNSSVSCVCLFVCLFVCLLVCLFVLLSCGDWLVPNRVLCGRGPAFCCGVHNSVTSWPHPSAPHHHRRNHCGWDSNGSVYYNCVCMYYNYIT